MLISVFLGKQVAEDGARIHRRVDLLAVGHHRVARQRVVVLPACQLANAADLAVDGAQTRAVALAPDHALVIGGRDLAAALNQGAVGIEESCVLYRVPPSRSLTPMDTTTPACLARLADGVGGGRRHGHRLVEQLQVLRSGKIW